MGVVPMVTSEHFCSLPGDAEWNLPAIWRYLKINLVSCFPGGSGGKEAACNAEDPDSISELGKITWRRKWQPTPVFLPGEFQFMES